MNSFFIWLQCIAPQHFISSLMGWLANQRTPWLKNWMIRSFIQRYKIDLSEAIIKDPNAFPSFNDFFVRHLNMTYRPFADGDKTIISPVDGTISEIGRIAQNQLIQAKGHHFNLDALLGEKQLAELFYDGNFSTLYLAPNNYHRVHTPLTGKLKKVIFVPGRLFSVNRSTAESIPDLYSRNERLICLFETNAGPMAVILVGAIIVGSMQLSWMDHAIKSSRIETLLPEKNLAKGADLGCFKVGSTVIVLFSKDAINWNPNLTVNMPVNVGEAIGRIA